MKCPFCQKNGSRVVDSRLSKEGSAIRRRRQCTCCEMRFTTYERVEEVQLMVVKKDGTRQAFSRSKVLRGIRRACEKRAVSADQMEAIVDTLERELHEVAESEIPSSYIGERLMDALRRVDDVAYVRFASVYRSFHDVTEFLDEAKYLISTRDKPQ